MLERAEVPNPKTDDGGLLLPFKAMDSVLPTQFDDDVWLSKEDEMLWLL